MAKQKYMWGAWVVWNTGEQARARGRAWVWWNIAGEPMDVFGMAWCMPAFTDRRKEIMPLVRHWRSLEYVKSCTPVKVAMPEGPADE